MSTKTKLAFIGPLPQPFGGVAVMNESIQNLLIDKYEMVSYNTSKGEEREDLYNNKTFKKILKQIKKLKKFINFSRDSTFTICNLFVTSGIGFLREAIFILIMKLYKKKIIIHLHSKKKGEFFLSPFRIHIFSYFLNKADKIIVLSNDHYNYFINYFDKDKMVVIENFVDYELYKCDIKDKIDEFLYVGRLSEKKGFFDLLKSIELLKNNGTEIYFNVLGVPENDEEEKKIQKFIEEKDIAKYLKFHGLKYGAEKLELFKRCKFFIFPSQFENSPVVLKEAIASRMAIISSDIEANRNVLNVLDKKEYFKANCYNSMASSIKNIFKDTEKNFKMMKASEKVKIYDKNIAKQNLISIIQGIDDEKR